MHYKFEEIYYIKEEFSEKPIMICFGKRNKEKRKEIHIWLVIEIQNHL